MPFRVVAHPCAYFAYTRAYTRVSWRRSLSDSAHRHSPRTLPHDIACYMLASPRLSSHGIVGYSLVIRWLLVGYCHVRTTDVTVIFLYIQNFRLYVSAKLLCPHSVCGNIGFCEPIFPQKPISGAATVSAKWGSAL